MTNQNLTDIVVILDRSRSMDSIRDEAERSLNRLVEEQRALPGEATLTFVRFDTTVETAFERLPLKEVGNLALVPRGLTALNDAIGLTVTRLGSIYAAMVEDERPGKVVVVIVTDGFENASRVHTQSAVAEMVKHQQEVYGWEFVFLAANQDAVLTGQGYGIDAGSAITFAASPQGVNSTVGSLNTYLATTRSGGSYQFTDDDRAAAVDNS